LRAWIVLVGLIAAAVTSSGVAAECPGHMQFLQAKCAQWQSYLLPASIPAAHGNAVADNDAAAALGMKIFYDNRFSQSGSGAACVSCHDPEHAFAEQKSRSHTIREAARNAPDLLDASWYTRSHFWDGKVDTLWAAPLFTFEQPDEMGSSRLRVVHTLSAIYKDRYEKLFGPLPDLSDPKRFPADGKPGMPQFDAMSEQDKHLVDQVYANIGKALEAYVRKVAAGRSQFDNFINGSPNALSADAQRGMVAFTKYGCDSCHSGPTFTDEGFHNLGYPRKSGQARDPARAGGKALARKLQFSATGPFADPTKEAPPQVQLVAEDPAGFRTPSLRNVKLTYPYGHDGSFATLEEAIAAHSRVLPNKSAPGPNDVHDLVEFLNSLSGRPPRPPWNYWPGG